MGSPLCFRCLEAIAPTDPALVIRRARSGRVLILHEGCWSAIESLAFERLEDGKAGLWHLHLRPQPVSAGVENA